MPENAKTGWLRVVGLGPGDAAMLTPEASQALETASDVLGYTTYLDRVPHRPGQVRFATDNREELDRARHALTLAAQGCQVALVSGGDPGVFAMASAVFEAMEHGLPAWRALDVAVIPGISAMFAAAARLGAPLGHDFCAISLSDNLKPWALIERRLRLAAQAGFVMALYNPRSKARPDQLAQGFAILRAELPPDVPVAFARAVGSAQERIHLTTLEAADPALVCMRTLVLIGTAGTRLVPRPQGGAFVYTSRSASA